MLLKIIYKTTTLSTSQFWVELIRSTVHGPCQETYEYAVALKAATKPGRLELFKAANFAVAILSPPLLSWKVYISLHPYIYIHIVIYIIWSIVIYGYRYYLLCIYWISSVVSLSVVDLNSFICKRPFFAKLRACSLA
jgi:hypothetical protein